MRSVFPELNLFDQMRLDAKRQEALSKRLLAQVEKRERRIAEIASAPADESPYARHLLRIYKLTWLQYLALGDAQSWSCAICLRVFQPPAAVTCYKSGLLVDHCHKTGKVRGLLCHSCNTGIGKLGDNPGNLMRAAQYLWGSR